MCHSDSLMVPLGKNAFRERSTLKTVLLQPQRRTATKNNIRNIKIFISYTATYAHGQQKGDSTQRSTDRERSVVPPFISQVNANTELPCYKLNVLTRR